MNVEQDKKKLLNATLFSFLPPLFVSVASCFLSWDYSIKAYKESSITAGATLQCFSVCIKEISILEYCCHKLHPTSILSCPLSVQRCYYTIISFWCSSLVALERRRWLCSFMLVWAHELSGEEKMANLGLSKVERIKGWKHPDWQDDHVDTYVSVSVSVSLFFYDCLELVAQVTLQLCLEIRVRLSNRLNYCNILLVYSIY